MMIQETGMQDGIHKKESSSGEKLHLCFSSHKNKSIAGTAGAQPELVKVGKHSCNKYTHVDKHFVKNTRKKGPTGNNFGVFSSRHS